MNHHGNKRLRNGVCSRCRAIHRRKYAAYCQPCHAANMRDWRKTHPMNAEQKRRDNCRSYSRVLMLRGKLVPGPCADCGGAWEHMHHEDYSKPREVTWLCKPCHGQRHDRETIG